VGRKWWSVQSRETTDLRPSTRCKVRTENCQREAMSMRIAGAHSKVSRSGARQVGMWIGNHEVHSEKRAEGPLAPAAASSSFCVTK